MGWGLGWVRRPLCRHPLPKPFLDCSNAVAVVAVLCGCMLPRPFAHRTLSPRLTSHHNKIPPH